MSTADDEPWRLRLCVEDDAGRTMPLERWLISIQTELDRLKATIEQLSIQSRNIVQELSALGSGLAESHRSAQGFRGAAADLHQRMDELDRRLNNILAKVEENLGGGQTEQAMRHHDYVDEYVALVEQKITGLAREIVPDSHPDAAREKARFVAEVCTRLFKEPEVLEQQLIDDLSAQTAAPDGAVQRMRDICTGARALRAKIAHGLAAALGVRRRNRRPDRRAVAGTVGGSE
jgi:chromosome segregation ATPase